MLSRKCKAQTSLIDDDSEENVSMNEQKTGPTSLLMSNILKGEVKLPEVDEFEKLFKYEDRIESRLTTYQGKRHRNLNGLNPSIVPYDNNRIKLKKLVDGNDYVNASYISPVVEDSNYDMIIYSEYVPSHQIKFMVGQDPTP